MLHGHTEGHAEQRNALGEGELRVVLEGGEERRGEGREGRGEDCSHVHRRIYPDTCINYI